MQTALQGEVSQSSINENIQYYDNYIMEETRKGKSEEEVIEQLGSPRLIAKTLIDTTDQFGTYNGERDYSENYGRGSSREFYDEHQEQGRRTLNIRVRMLMVILVAVLFIVIIANVVAFLLPFLVPIILIWLIYSLFFGSRR